MIEGFNAEQSLAIETPSDIDVIISAGAGSGKTKTLTKKVFTLVDEDIIQPSELLVLTFTNAAAHEMKERIIKAFGGNKKAKEMLSAHVQTFDSFSQYLVATNAEELGISSAIKIADDSILNVKRLSLLDELLAEHYENPIKRERLLATLKKIDFKTDENLRKDVLAISSFLSKLSPDKHRDFVEHYEDKYLSDELKELIIKDFVTRAKKDIRMKIRDAYFLEKHQCFLTPDQPISVKEAKEAYEDSLVFNLPLSSLSFEDKKANELVAAIVPLLQKDGMDFVSACLGFADANANLLATGRKKKSADEQPVFEEPFKRIRLLFATKAFELGYLSSINVDEPFSRVLSLKDDVLLLIELAEELERRLGDYKRSTNSFTFSDIQSMALSLLKDPKHEKVAESIRGRFNFIMVDEYQDTNDFQEQFIDALALPRKDGTRAHLFFVGDAKQAIYAFRGSNVGLFRKRQADYSHGEGHIVIDMNKNYRSCPLLLNDINYIFRQYMRLDHGGIDFTQPAEQLAYDEKVDIYRLPYDNAGIYRIHSVSERLDDGVNPMEWEVSAIISDIRKKIKDGYLVYDRDIKGTRPCTYKDFLILMRKKRNFAYYSQRFQEAGIPLNSELSVTLRDIDPVLLVQSLSGIISAKINQEPADIKHLFASIARSYAYRYDDSTIFALCMDDKLLEQDPLMQQIDAFASKYATSQFEDIFLAMIDEFRVVSELYSIGNVQDSISKIDSLHALALNLSSMGEGMAEFAKLFRDLDKYGVEISSDVTLNSENAVGMLSIHKSKGLEQKIVYMPESVNSLSKGTAMGKPDIDISLRYGVLLPDYSVEREEGQIFVPDHSVYPLNYLAFNNSDQDQIDLDEHVRLFYVALTRAENSLYFVGDSLNREEDIFAMLESTSSYEVIDKEFRDSVALFSTQGAQAISTYEEMCNIRIELPTFQNPTIANEADAEIRDEIIAHYFTTVLNQKMEASKDVVRIAALDRYLSMLKDGVDNDLLARFTAHYYFGNPNVKNLLELNDYIRSRQNDSPETEDDEGTNSVEKTYSIEDLKKIADALIGIDLDFFKLKITKEQAKADAEGAAKRIFSRKVVGSLAYAFDEFKKVFSKSYETKGYLDKNYAFDYFAAEGIGKAQNLSLPKVDIDDTPIDFKPFGKKKASKTLSAEDEETIRPILERGELLHRYMEIVDFRTKDTSFIADPSDRAIIDRALKIPCFQDVEEADIYKEYGYYDPELNSQGYIDLLLVKDGNYWIIDYKSSHIEDEAYDAQLKNYARNVARLFNVEQSKIRMTLVSLLQGKSREVFE